LRLSCVSSHFLRRLSSGCAESGAEDGEAEVVCLKVGPTPARSVSWIPGAEGAPKDLDSRWEWEVEWPDGGTIRIA
jgi:hypothetical protein